MIFKIRLDSWLTSADWLGRPVPCISALYLSPSIQYIVLIAGVLNLILVAMLSHYSKGDEAIRYACWDGAAHLWDEVKKKKKWGGIIQLLQIQFLRKEKTGRLAKLC